MTPQQYIQTSLDELRFSTSNINMPPHNSKLSDVVLQLLTTKKFRKYALSEQYKEHVRKSVLASVQANEPIKIIFFGGCYKLWRLSEAPEADWAEVFAYMYYTKWLKPICDIYEPGVWFDFLLDDYIVPKLNNISAEDVETYRSSRDIVLDFIKPYQPPNLNMTHTGEGSLFESKHEYEVSLTKAVRELSGSLDGGLPSLSKSEISSVELNTRATASQKKDPKWREKVELLHSAYYLARDKTGYYAPETNKIICFTQPFAPGRPLAVGSTKDSVAKYWVGVGALRPRGDSYRQLVLSPNQIKNTEFKWQDINLGIKGKNFTRIRVTDD